MGLFEFKKKLASIPESEPLHLIIKSRTINISKIKNKEEKKYWNELKRINRIPSVYLSNEELSQQLQNSISSNGGLNKNLTR